MILLLPSLKRTPALTQAPDKSVCESKLHQRVQGGPTGDELCVVREQAAPCRGDSGGPVFVTSGANNLDADPPLKALAGVVSQARPNCSETNVAIVAAFDAGDLAWIKSTTGM